MRISTEHFADFVQKLEILFCALFGYALYQENVLEKVL